MQGSLQLHGAPSLPSWTWLAATAAAGSSGACNPSAGSCTALVCYAAQDSDARLHDQAADVWAWLKLTPDLLSDECMTTS